MMLSGGSGAGALSEGVDGANMVASSEKIESRGPTLGGKYAVISGI